MLSLSGHHSGEALKFVIASIAFREGRATERTAPNDKGALVQLFKTKYLLNIQSDSHLLPPVIPN